MRPTNRWQGGATTWILGAILAVGVAILAVLVAILLRASHTTAAAPTVVATPPAVAPAPTPAPAIAAQKPTTLTPVDTSNPPPANRSPIPEPGESFDKPYPAAIVTDAAPRRSSTRRESEPTASAPTLTVTPIVGGTIAWHEAPKHVGKRITVEGKIIAAHNTGKVCFLNFERDPKSPFYLILFKDVLDDFPEPPEKYFLNKTVRATGEVFARDDRFQIRVERKDQILLAPSP